MNEDISVSYNKSKKMKKNIFYRSARSLNSLLLLLTFSLLIASCKKNPVEETITTQINKKRISSNLDSIYLYAQQIYLWNDQLSSFTTFKPSRFYTGAGHEMDMYNKEIFDFTRAAINPTANMSFELNMSNPGTPKYSGITEGFHTSSFTKNEVQPVLLSNNFGLSFATVSDNEIRLLYVDSNSPAGKAGLNRGDRIIKINGIPVQTNEIYYRFIESSVKNAFIDIVLISENTPVINNKNIRLTQAPFEANPVLKSKVISFNNRKIGYVAYKRFTDESLSARHLNPVFDNFGNEDISELIIDLRYNGGGYQNTCRYIANQIIPANLNGKTMFTEHYNPLMQGGKADILKNQPILDANENPVYIDGRHATLNDIDYSVKGNTVLFEKQGEIKSIKSVYFIVSKETASASELLISILQPYMKVTLIGVSGDGTNVRTYGKPVGFFDIKIDKFNLYLAMYQDKNANNDGNYFDGFSTNLSVIDNPVFNFGDLADPAIQIALGNPSQTNNPRNKSNLKSASLQTSTVHSSKIYFYDKIERKEMLKSVKDFKLK